ncbi:MAG: PCP reductase family protein [Xenococcus sp. (in: cyanobacteria)]
MASNQFSLINNLFWTQDAQIKLNKIPFFVRIQARQRIEELAHLAQLEEVTVEIVEQARSEFSQ